MQAFFNTYVQEAFRDTYTYVYRKVFSRTLDTYISCPPAEFYPIYTWNLADDCDCGLCAVPVISVTGVGMNPLCHPSSSPPPID